MRRTKWSLLIGAVLVLPAHANELERQLKMASGLGQFVMPEHSELEQITEKFRAALNDAEKPIEWQNSAMESHRHKDFTIIQENSNMRRGRGFFALHNLETKQWLLQAPHADTDLLTGKIACRLFLEGSFKAAQWNSVPRHAPTNAPAYSADMAHQENSYWQAFTSVFAEKYPDGKIIQIHGFDPNARKTKSGENSDMILSAGHSNPPQWLKQTAACLKNAFPNRVSLYPSDVKELGGTTNVQGRLLQQLGHNGFLHIEMSKKMRQQLLEKSEARTLLIQCL